MLKEEFLKTLTEKISRLSEGDRDELIGYYAELIEDRIDGGLDEEAVVDGLGDIDEIADSVIASIPADPDGAKVYTEDHSVIDCTNRYISEDNRFIFSIKLPAGTKLGDVLIEITSDCEGTVQFCTDLSRLDSSEEWAASVVPDHGYNGGSHTYQGSDHYLLITDKLAPEGMGIRLYISVGDKHYMATDTALKSTKKGRGYWLSSD